MKSRERRKGRARAAPGPGGRAEPSASATPAIEDAEPVPAEAAPEPTSDAATDVFERWFVPIALGILLVAAALRLPELALNPFHHDEGINGFFTTNLVREGRYVYDPANYHGPSLYYFALFSEVLFGLTDVAMRLVPVVFGLLLVAFVFPLRDRLGSLAVLVAAGLLAVSPGAVHISRYFIHEALLVAFTLGLVTAVVLYIDRRESMYLLWAAVAAALMFTTKETGIITIAVLLIAIAVGHFYYRWRTPAKPQRAGGRAPARRKSVWIDGVEYKPTGADRGGAEGSTGFSLRSIPLEHLAGAAVVFLVIYVLLYSSFFTNFPKGLIDSLATFTIWTQTGEATQIQPIWKYLQWMLPTEAPILVLGTVGGLIAAIRAPSRLWVVIGLWAAGITMVYSIIQYKTPWLTLNMLLPLALLAGLVVTELWRSQQWRRAVPAVLGVAVLASGAQAIDLNYRHYDDETYPYVFAHTTRDALRMIDDIEATAERAGTGRETGIVFVTPEYWPLPWYFRDYPRAGFFGSIVATEEAMIVSKVDQEAELAPTIEDRYDRVATYTLRPGVDLALYVRSDIPRE